MYRLFLLWAALCLSTSTLQAREVDHYMAWGVYLEDMGPVVDQYMRENLAAGLDTVNQTKYRSIPNTAGVGPRKKVIPEKFFSCTYIAPEIMRAAFFSPTYQKIEKFLDSAEGIDRFPRRPEKGSIERRQSRGEMPSDGYMTNMEYLRASIIGSSPFYVPLSRVINLHGIYTGADKLGHFTSFGARYLTKFRDLVFSGMSYEEAFMRVLELGYKSERSVVGMTFTGVFSRGDLEANFQGMVFAVSLCRPESEIRLHFDGQNWQLLNLDNFTIKPYVNPDWDESYNTSIYSDGKWRKHVTPKFESNRYCDNLASAWFLAQREFYQEFEDTSLNQQLEDNWLPLHFPGFDPIDHSLEHYCGLPELYPLK